jgi:hypothetical protein
MAMTNEQKRAMYAKNRGIPKHLGNLDTGAYTNPHGDTYKVMPDKTMFMYDYLLSKNYYIKSLDSGKMVGTQRKQKWQPMAKKDMIAKCNANGNSDICNTSIAKSVTTYMPDDVSDVRQYCQAHAMNINFTRVKQDGTVIPKTNNLA